MLRLLALNLLWIIHVLFWACVLFLPFFGTRRVVYFIAYILVPGVYVLHMLPFHILNAGKETVTPSKEQLKRSQEMYQKEIPVLAQYQMTSDYLSRKCTFNPISPQGMLLFSMIACLYRLYPPSRFPR